MKPVLDIFDSSSGADVHVGRARFNLRRGEITTSFTYDSTYISQVDSYSIDPALPLSAGAQHCVGIPGIFKDSSPDRWGRHLIYRAFQDEHEGSVSPIRQLDDVDYLVGVLDQTREGSLRFCEPGGEFLSPSGAIPPIIQLPALLNAARQVSVHTAGKQQIKELLNAGSGSLGGARPKASVIEDEKLLLAKFSHTSDEWNVMGWEKTALDLARLARISVPGSKLIQIGKECVLVLNRFDRTQSKLNGRRIPYMSAMTLLGASDGQQRDYAELAEAIARLSKNIQAELTEMYKRVVFSFAINNTDDHLRNWGFIRKNDKWYLSPAFDINPTPNISTARATSIVGEESAHKGGALKEFAKYAGITDEDAKIIVKNILDATSSWQQVAKKNKCPEREILMFSSTIEYCREQLATTFNEI